MSHSLLKSFCYMHLWLILIALSAGVSVVAQDKSARRDNSQSQSLSMGVLAVQSQQQGLLFIDGQRIQPIVPGNIVTLKLTAGQHFVDLRDEKGSILWQKIIEVPIGAQAAALIDGQKQPQSSELPIGNSNSARPTGAPASAISQPTAPSLDHAAFTVPVGSIPHAVAINTATNRIYVANRDSITIIDGATNSTTTVAAGTKPSSLAINLSTNKVYVANSDSNDVTVIDGVSNSVITIPVGIHPQRPAINSKTNKVYVPNEGSDTVSVIDGYTNKTHALRVGKSPFAIAVNEVTDMIYVSCGDSKNVAVIDGTKEKVTTFVNNVYWEHLAVDTERNLVYTGGTRMLLDRDEVKRFLSRFSPEDPWKSYADHVGETIPATLIDGRSNVSRDIKRDHPVSVNPDETGVEDVSSITVDPVSHKAYISMSIHSKSKNTSTHVFALNALTNQMQEIMVGPAMSAADIAVNPVTNVIYVANYGSDTVSVIDGTTNATTTIPVGKRPGHIAVNPVTNKIYVSHEFSGSVTVLDGATLSSGPK